MFLKESDSKDQSIVFIYLFLKLFHSNPGILEPLAPYQSTKSLGDDS